MVRFLFHQGVVEAEDQKTGWELALVGSTIQLLIHLHRAQMAQANAPMKAETPQLVDHVLEYIENHLGEDISIEQLCRELRVGRTRLYEIFRNEHKAGISKYILRRKMHREVNGKCYHTVGGCRSFDDYEA